MPYKSISELPANVKKALTSKQQSVFMKAFNAAFAKHGEEKSFKIAWTMARRNKAKANPIKCYTVSAKSNLSDAKAYFAEFQFADIYEDRDGDKVPQDVLLDNITGMEGDIEHCNLFNKEGFDRQKLFDVVNAFYLGDKLVGKVMFNPNHKEFPIVWDLVQKDEFGISMEYDMLDWEIKGVTGTMDPRNSRSKLISTYTAS